MALPIAAILALSAAQAAGSIGGGYLKGKQEKKTAESGLKKQLAFQKKQLNFQKDALRQAAKETKLQRTNRKLIDELLGSLTGQGKFSDLFKSDEEAFQRSYVQPSISRFQNQIAPAIQQQYQIDSGPITGGALNDQLLRAGVDINSLLDQQYAGFQQAQQNKQFDTISKILGYTGGAQNPNYANLQLPQFPGVLPSNSSILGGATAGYLSSDAFKQSLSDIAKSYSANPSPVPRDLSQYQQPRRGFAPDYQFNYSR